MEQKFYLKNGEGYLQVVNVVQTSNAEKWKTIIHCAPDGINVYTEIMIKEGNDINSIVKNLCDKLGLSIK